MYTLTVNVEIVSETQQLKHTGRASRILVRRDGLLLVESGWHPLLFDALGEASDRVVQYKGADNVITGLYFGDHADLVPRLPK